ncbi:hypothetical protein G7072_15910 [Nocardioides sp. HDW12B]|uniref:hypothetical protein n=1 Tax=Nocardioides sp. HDW12B TaxID=2714939 RepID=UPI001408245C|nr:hypothetical protein [Nocardioides sp. HDW12B]QIK67637.1 hypothetical protein G7072_15910 [Nocardioides sp. HDW12B]
MTTKDELDRVTGWFRARLPEEWAPTEAEITVDREEITVLIGLPDVAVAEGDSDEVAAEARGARAEAFREETRKRRMDVAEAAQRRFGRAVSWGVAIGARAAEDTGDGVRHRELWTHVAAPVMTRLRQPQRLVLDTLVEAGVARSRADALAWCVRLVGQHEDDWLGELRAAMTGVREVRERGPRA